MDRISGEPLQQVRHGFVFFQFLCASALFHEVCELSPMLVNEDIGIFVYLDEKDIPAIQPDDEKLVQASNFLQRYASFISANALLNELVTAGLSIETK